MATKTLYFVYVFSLFLSQIFAREVHKFPNPNRDVNSCGRDGVKSWICDPDQVLKKENADKLEALLTAMHYETDSGCNEVPEGERGYEIAIAVVRNMELLQGESSAEAAVRFAKTLHDKWGVGKKNCNDGVLVFLSVDDRQIYISTGHKTKEKLSNEQIDLIIESTRPYLREKEYGKALGNVLVNSKSVLEGKPLAATGWNFMSLLSIAFCLGLVAILVGVVQNYFKRKTFNEFKKKLGKIDKERQNPKEYKSLICPVCLEDFKSETKVKLLVCGHKYCAPCLSEWLKTNTSCPICRQKVDREAMEETGNKQHDRFTELSFRLTSLQSQYPDFVTQDIMTHWLFGNIHGTLLDDVNRRYGSGLPSNRYDGSFGSSSGFGGGSSIDGGGSGGSW